jgi:diguanylate cyclase (GGDEF)-like protein
MAVPEASTQASTQASSQASSLLRDDPSDDRDRWVVRAQDGAADEVLAEIEAELRTGIGARARTGALYAQAICLLVLGRVRSAIPVARELAALCREQGLQAAGLQARALVVDLLRRDGQLEEAVDQLAQATALEPALRDLTDPDVQTALGALAVALRLSGVADEANRIERRLAAVEGSLPVQQRVARWSNLAFEHTAMAFAAARRPPFRIDDGLLDQAVAEIERARGLAGAGGYEVVTVEARVISALPNAVIGDARAGLTRLAECDDVLRRGPEAVSAQTFWAAGTVRCLVRLGRASEAAAFGARMLARLRAGRAERQVLAYEVMRAENPAVESPGTGAGEYLALAEERSGTDLTLLSALFRARVDLLRGADERRLLARAAQLDSLTGLVNRRGAASAVSEAAALPAPEPVALLLIDLDGFKDVNDNAGHLAGDVVLQRVATALRTAARLDDIVARWGGDEFVVVAVLDEDRALALADRLRDTIRDDVGRPAVFPVTGSVGVAVRDAPLDEEAWLRRADEAMYAAKRTGGDATVLG